MLSVECSVVWTGPGRVQSVECKDSGVLSEECCV